MKRVLIPILFLSLSGCLTVGPTDGATPPAAGQAPVSNSLKAQEQAEQAALNSLLQSVKAPKASKDNYRIGPSDLVDITVFREVELNRTVRVNQDGEISFPLVGTVKIGGKSIIEAEQAIAAGLGDYLKQPQVSIFIKEYSAKQVFVLGEVKNPGAFPLPTEAGLTVLEAISLAGGFTQVASQDRTRVIRTSPDGKSQYFTIEVSAIMKRGEKGKDIPLLPSDVVHVPQSYF